MNLGLQFGLSPNARGAISFDVAAAANLTTGLVTLPSWLAITCATTGRTTQTSATTVKTGLGANAARARNVGGGTGLSVERAATNIITTAFNWANGSGNWAGAGSVETPGQADPAGGTAAVQHALANNTFATYQNLVFQGVASAWAYGVSRANAALPYGHLCVHSNGVTGAFQELDVASTWTRLNCYSSTSEVLYEFDKRNVPTGATTITTASAVRLWGGQFETGSAYPTSLIEGSRAADVLSVPTPSTIAPGGYFDLDFTVAPNYSQAEQAADHNLAYFDANNRIYIQQSSHKIVLRIGGVNVLSSALTWSRETSLRIQASHTAGGRRLVVLGATTGNGDSGIQSAAAALTLPATAYLLGSNTGAEECADLRAFSASF